METNTTNAPQPNGTSTKVEVNANGATSTTDATSTAGVSTNTWMAFLYTGITFLVIALLFSLITPTKFIDLFTLFVAVLVYMILPGFSILLNFKMDALELLAYSVPLSIALNTTLIYLLNVLLKVPINRISVLVVVLFFTLVGVFFKKIFKLPLLRSLYGE